MYVVIIKTYFAISFSELSDIELNQIGSHLDPSDFFLLGGRLDFNKSRLNQFKHNNPGDIANAMSSMLIAWRNDQSGPHSSIRKILSAALRQAERADLAESVLKLGNDYFNFFLLFSI